MTPECPGHLVIVHISRLPVLPVIPAVLMADNTEVTDVDMDRCQVPGVGTEASQGAGAAGAAVQ